MAAVRRRIHGHGEQNLDTTHIHEILVLVPGSPEIGKIRNECKRRAGPVVHLLHTLLLDLAHQVGEQRLAKLISSKTSAERSGTAGKARH